MKNKYRIRNWSKYNAGLKLRGSITLWFSTDVVEEWLVNEKTGRRGASATYSDTAIATMSTIKSVFSLAGRQPNRVRRISTQTNEFRFACSRP